jgi:hypothetical protein
LGFKIGGSLVGASQFSTNAQKSVGKTHSRKTEDDVIDYTGKQNRQSILTAFNTEHAF